MASVRLVLKATMTFILYILQMGKIDHNEPSPFSFIRQEKLLLNEIKCTLLADNILRETNGCFSVLRYNILLCGQKAYSDMWTFAIFNSEVILLVMVATSLLLSVIMVLTFEHILIQLKHCKHDIIIDICNWKEI